jgi:hypothetical protein
VGNQEFQGSGFCGRKCDDDPLGASIPIIYSRKNPANSECTSLNEVASRIFGHYFALAGFALVLGFGIFRATRFLA